MASPAQQPRLLAEFLNVRPRLFGIAYRMLGSASEAEDIVQDVWLRWQAADRSTVIDPPAFLATTATRLALNFAQSARARRESYVGPWLPEPVDTSADPQLGAERNQALEIAILLLLEKLTPTERAAYVLREAFDYPYSQIASILQLEEANVRQLVTRARQHIADNRRKEVSPDEQRRLLEAFVSAAKKGDLQGLERLLSADVVSYSDGGGVVRTAARAPISGAQRVAKFITSFSSHFWLDISLEVVNANGKPAIIMSRGGKAAGFVTIAASDLGIDQIFWILRPSKLTSTGHP